MGFRDFITNFRYRMQLEASFDQFQNIKPPKNPSRRYIDKLVARLWNEDTIWLANRELSMMGPAVVPSLLAALQDPRFHRHDDEEILSPLNAMLELLVRHAVDEVVRITSPLIKSSFSNVRKTAALHLASAGQGDTIPLLRELMHNVASDDDDIVRSYVIMGIQRAVAEGRADEEFRCAGYDLLLSQCDQKRSDVAEAIVALDPHHAAIDLGAERWLNLSNPNAHRILEACNKARILLPEHLVRRLLEETLPATLAENCYPHNYIAAAALYALALCDADGTGEMAESLLKHENDEVKIAAAQALVVLADISEPIGLVMDRVKQKGYTGLSHEQRVVYCAFLFDAEVCNGGLMQFFGNSSGDHAVDTLEALSELGHTVAHASLSNAMQLIGPLARKTNRDLRLTAFEGRWEELQSAFNPLENAYYTTKAQLEQEWLLYTARHPEHFRR